MAAACYRPHSEGIVKVLFSQVCVCSQEGSPSSPMGGVPSSQVLPPSVRMDAVIPPPPPTTRQSSTASTCYAAGNMPLVFKQKNFLVLAVLRSNPLVAHRQFASFLAVVQPEVSLAGTGPVSVASH